MENNPASWPCEIGVKTNASTITSIISQGWQIICARKSAFKMIDSSDDLKSSDEFYLLVRASKMFIFMFIAACELI